MNYEPKTFDFETIYDYFIDYKLKILVAKRGDAYIKVNSISDSSRTRFYPIRQKDGVIKYILVSEIFKRPKTWKKPIQMTQATDEDTIRKEKRNAYMKEYMGTYLKKYRTEMLKSEMTTHPLENKQGLEILPMEWFIGRIWKKVYRDKSPCGCDDCTRHLNFGWVIEDEQDAIRLYNEQIKYKVGFYEVKENKW